MASSSYNFLNCSKAQMCLFKILHIISSIPPFKQEPSSSHGDDRSESSPNNNNKGIGIDLNLRFCSVAESGGESESSVIDQENNEEGEEGEAIRDKSVEVSDDRDTQVQSFKVGNNEDGDVESESEEDREGNEVKTVSCGESNCIDLLIEAAKVLSKREELSDEKASEAEAVVATSKKTRNRALPYRFRDSVVEPLKRAQRPSSTSHAKKRRLLRS